MSDLTKKLRNNSRRSGKAPYIRIGTREVSVWVDPEERDYWYNLDYMCGTYHGNPRRKHNKDKIMPCHGLGYGSDDDADAPCREQENTEVR